MSKIFNRLNGIVIIITSLLSVGCANNTNIKNTGRGYIRSTEYEEEAIDVFEPSFIQPKSLFPGSHSLILQHIYSDTSDMLGTRKIKAFDILANVRISELPNTENGTKTVTFEMSYDISNTAAQVMQENGWNSVSFVSNYIVLGYDKKTGQIYNYGSYTTDYNQPFEIENESGGFYTIMLLDTESKHYQNRTYFQRVIQVPADFNDYAFMIISPDFNYNPSGKEKLYISDLDYSVSNVYFFDRL